MNEENKKVLLNIIGAVESGGQMYGQRNYGSYAGKYQNSKKELTCTLGWAQFYGYEAMELLRRIYAKSPQTFIAADNANIKTVLDRDWVDIGWNPTTAQRQSLINIITTPVGKLIQDELAMEKIDLYLKRAEEFGVTDVGAQMMWAEIQHLGGRNAAERIFKKAKQPYTVNSVFAALMSDQSDKSNNNQVGDKLYQSRHEKCVEFIKRYAIAENKEGGIKMARKQELIDRVIARASSWIGYVEKASNRNLESKTANPGTSNYTRFGKIMHDLYPSVMDFPAAWCDAFVDCCFYEEFGVATAKSLLCGNFDDYTVNSAAMYKKHNAYFSTPERGDQIFFDNGKRICHTGLVSRVSNGMVYTIEGNTSSIPGVVPNGGMVREKSYPLGYARINGYGRPRYDLFANSSAQSLNSDRTQEQARILANEIIKTGQICANNFANAGLDVDGIRGLKTIIASRKCLQVAMNADYGCKLEVDGEIGPKTKAALKGHYVRKGESQWMVTFVQIGLLLDGYNPNGLECPGIFGEGLESAVIQYQKDKGLEVDGIVGINTFLSLVS